MDLKQVKAYKAIILLNEVISNGKIFKEVPDGNDYMLQPILNDLVAAKCFLIENGEYKLTEAGETSFNNFMNKYNEYLKLYDIYCAVDTATGEFAFSKIFEMQDNPEVWDAYKNDKRFFDLRIAVATFKKLDPCEIVFMSFINENRFDTTKEGWQIGILADTIWAEIDNIVNTAITIDDFGGEDAIKNLVEAGTNLMFELINKELELKKAELERVKQLELQQTLSNEQVVTEEVVVETTTVEEIEESIGYYEDDLLYYDPYWDPFYVSPIWIAPIFIDPIFLWY